MAVFLVALIHLLPLSVAFRASYDAEAVDCSKLTPVDSWYTKKTLVRDRGYREHWADALECLVEDGKCEDSFTLYKGDWFKCQKDKRDRQRKSIPDVKCAAYARDFTKLGDYEWDRKDDVKPRQCSEKSAMGLFKALVGKHTENCIKQTLCTIAKHGSWRSDRDKGLISPWPERVSFFSSGTGWRKMAKKHCSKTLAGVKLLDMAQLSERVTIFHKKGNFNKKICGCSTGDNCKNKKLTMLNFAD